jgi:hypothetical protein
MNLLQRIVALFKQGWQEVEVVSEEVGTIILNALEATWAKVTPAQLEQLAPIIVKALADVAGGDLADAEAAVLNEAETQGLAFVAELGDGVRQALIAGIKAATPAAA